MFRTLRSKLIFSYAAVSVLMLGLALVVSLFLANDYARKTGFRTLQEKRAVAFPFIRATLAQQRALGVRRPTLNNLVEESMRTAKLRILLLDPDTFTVEVDTQKKPNMAEQPFPFKNTTEARASLSAGDPVTGTISLPGEKTRFQYIAQKPLDQASRGQAGGAQQGQGGVPRLAPQQIVVIAQPEPNVAGLASEAKDFLVPGILIALAASLGVAYFLARSLTKPLSRLAGAAGAMARGEYNQRLPVQGHDEIAILTEQFNIMAQEVGDAHEMQRDFVANVSHDLKTPLTSIQGFSQAMLDGSIKEETQYRQAATIINDEARRMSRLVSQLLSLSQLQSGLRTMELRPVELEPLLGQLALTMQPQALSAGVELRARFAYTTALLLADADKLKQALGNIMDNAIKHTPAGGAVTVSTTPLVGGVEIAVSDTGRGIPTADLHRVMERFYQVDKSRSSAQVSSLGLGLAIAREIIYAHHGQIAIESVEGQGTTVKITLPAARTTVTQAQGGRQPHTRRLLPTNARARLPGPPHAAPQTAPLASPSASGINGTNGITGSGEHENGNAPDEQPEAAKAEGTQKAVR